MKVLGIDPGLKATGYGILEVNAQKCKLLETGTIEPKKKDLIQNKINKVYRALEEILREYKPDVLVLEKLYSHYKRPQTAILMGHARGVICLAAQKAQKRLVHYSATQVKKVLTGSGRAPKHQVQQAVRRELGLAETPNPPDVADALAIAMCCHFLLSRHEVGAR